MNSPETRGVERKEVCALLLRPLRPTSASGLAGGKKAITGRRQSLVVPVRRGSETGELAGGLLAQGEAGAAAASAAASVEQFP